jgi:hypothetical protein
MQLNGQLYYCFQNSEVSQCHLLLQIQPTDSIKENKNKIKFIYFCSETRVLSKRCLQNPATSKVTGLTPTLHQEKRENFGAADLIGSASCLTKLFCVLVILSFNKLDRFRPVNSFIIDYFMT